MIKLLITFLLLLSPIVSADSEVSERVASVTCAVISETTLNQSAYRVKEVNEARSKLNLDPYLQGDAEILLSIKYGLCNLLIMDFDEYKKKSDIFVLAEETERKIKQEERRKVAERRRKAAEKLRRESEETIRNEEEERERRALQERVEEKNKIVQKFREDVTNLETAFNMCDLPNDSTKISIKKDKETLSFSIFMEFSDTVRASCPSLISGSRDLKGKRRRSFNETNRRETKKTFARSGWNNPELLQTTKDKLSRFPVTNFAFEAKIDGFKDNVVLNSSYMNVFPTFNIEYNSTKNTLLRGDIRFATTVGIDATIDFNKSPYCTDCRSGEWEQPTFTTEENLRKLKIGMIKEVSLVTWPNLGNFWRELTPADDIGVYFRKVIYVRDTK